MPNNAHLIDALTESELYRDYERAFSETTGLPVSLRPVEAWNLPHHGKKHENPFCEIMAEKSASCASCLRVQEKLAQVARDKPQTILCETGLSDTAVPVKIGEELIGFLQTGQIFRKKPTPELFARVSKKLADWGVEVTAELEKVYFETPVLTPQHYGQMVKLLSIFAQHLSMLSNQIAVRRQNEEPAMVAKAKAFLEENQTEDLTLDDVAKAVHVSTFHFCKVFKKATGLTYTEYLSRLRVERAKKLLLNPNLRISEIAYEVGFRSLTHFNRTFKKVAGIAPTDYRKRLP